METWRDTVTHTEEQKVAKDRYTDAETEHNESDQGSARGDAHPEMETAERPTRTPRAGWGIGEPGRKEQRLDFGPRTTR